MLPRSALGARRARVKSWKKKVQGRGDGPDAEDAAFGARRSPRSGHGMKEKKVQGRGDGSDAEGAGVTAFGARRSGQVMEEKKISG